MGPEPPGSVHHRSFKDAHHGGVPEAFPETSDAMRPIGPIAQRFAGLGPFRYAAGLDLELAFEDRQALDGTALMAF
jgi:hypothetical protein